MSSSGLRHSRCRAALFDTRGVEQRSSTLEVSSSGPRHSNGARCRAALFDTRAARGVEQPLPTTNIPVQRPGSIDVERMCPLRAVATHLRLHSRLRPTDLAMRRSVRVSVCRDHVVFRLLSDYYGVSVMTPRPTDTSRATYYKKYSTDILVRLASTSYLDHSLTSCDVLRCRRRPTVQRYSPAR